MDTIPFHFLMFAFDLILCGFLIFWVVFDFKLRRVDESGFLYDINNFPQVLYRDNSELRPIAERSSIAGGSNLSAGRFGVLRRFCWNISGVVLCGILILMCIVFFAVIFRNNFGQCAVEGLTFHVGFYLLFSAVLLFIRKNRIVSAVLFLFGTCVISLGVNMLYIEPNNLVYEFYKIKSSKIKTPVKVVFVADIQTDNIGEYERKTLRMIMEVKPDLIILGGDYLQYYKGTVGISTLPERFRQLLLEIPLEAPLGVYAIAGNVDYSSIEQFSELFKDTTVEPIFFSEMIDGLGEEENKGPIDIRFLSMADSIDGVREAALSESGNFTIVVGHYPNYAIKDYQFSERAPDLMLAGHTHGGQIYIPLWGALRVKYTNREAIITQEFLRGMKHFKNGSKLLITRGSGMERGWAPRIRFLCKPEISVIEIEPQK
jgi:predicted MPP superfamily phosphohydrolase